MIALIFFPLYQKIYISFCRKTSKHFEQEKNDEDNVDFDDDDDDDGHVIVTDPGGSGSSGEDVGDHN